MSATSPGETQPAGRPTRRWLARGATVGALALSGVLGTATLASAHHPEISATSECGGVVSFTATAWLTTSGAARTNPSIGVSYSTDGVSFTALPTAEAYHFDPANGYAFSDTFTVPGDENGALPPAVIVKVTALAPWGNGAAAGSTRLTQALDLEPCEAAPQVIPPVIEETPVVDEPVADQPVIDESPIVNEPPAEEPPAEEPASNQQPASQPGSPDRPAAGGDESGDPAVDPVVQPVIEPVTHQVPPGVNGIGETDGAGTGVLSETRTHHRPARHPHQPASVNAAVAQQLPYTGTNTLPLFVLGLLTVASGGALTFGARRPTTT